MFLSLVQRNNKLFLRDKTQVFFSLISVFVVIGLYIVFLQKTQIDAIQAIVPVTTEIKTMVNEWMVSGLISIIAVTTTLGAFGTYIHDLETKKIVDFNVTTISKAKIQLSYSMSAFTVGFILTTLAFVVCQIFLVLTGGAWLSFTKLIYVLGIITLSVLLSSVLNLFIVLFIKSQSAFATVSTIIGTLIGFLCGVYIPIGALPDFVQKLIHIFPVSHTTVLLRSALMEDSIKAVFPTEAAKAEYMNTFGVQYEFNNMIIYPWMSLLYIVVTIVIVGAISWMLFVLRNK